MADVTSDARPEFVVRTGSCRVLFVFDVGREVDLAAARRLVSEAVRDTPKKGAPLGVEPPPLRLEVPTRAIRVGGLAAEGIASVGVYDFGTLALWFSFPLAGTLADLRTASCAICGDATLAAAAREQATELFARLAPSIADAALAAVVEDYLVFEVRDFDAPVPLADVPARFAMELAQVLRSDARTPSSQEIRRATASAVSRTPDDLAVIDWSAALVVERDPSDVESVLEFVTVQLLEMRFLDRRLDESLHHAYDALSRGTRWRPVILPDALRQAMTRIGRRQVEAAILYERVANAIKLVGDPYLARVYRRAARRFGLASWHAALREKLATLDGIYAKLHDRASIVRAELLEWVVIVLILVSMAIPFIVR